MVTAAAALSKKAHMTLQKRAETLAKLNTPRSTRKPRLQCAPEALVFVDAHSQLMRQAGRGALLAPGVDALDSERHAGACKDEEAACEDGLKDGEASLPCSTCEVEPQTSEARES